MAEFVQFIRSEETEALMKNRNCFMLLALIAYRARRTSKFNGDNLEMGEALIGDHDSIGLTQREYRTAKNKIQKWGFATFKTTNRGTIAKILNTKVFDINEEKTTSETPSKRQARDKQETTNNNDNNDNNDNKQEQNIFVRPSVSEIKDYIREKDYGIDADHFYQYYETNDWQIKDKKGNLSPMKNWKLTLSTWNQNNKRSNKEARTTSFY